MIDRRWLLVPAVLVVASCGGAENPNPSDLPVFVLPGSLDDGAAMAAFFVSSISDFSTVLLTQIRESHAFRTNEILFRNTVAKPLLASRLDYARSTDTDGDGIGDLTGAGQVVSVIDSAILVTHEQFAPGKFLGTGGPLEDGHGTAVASVIAGDGSGTCDVPPCNMVGYAPDAQLHQGVISYLPGSFLDFNQLADYMNEARSLNARASNNSWTLAGGTVENSQGLKTNSAFLNYVSALDAFGSTGIVVFAASNEMTDTSASVMAALPNYFEQLEEHWLAVVNILVDYDSATDRLSNPVLLSAPCLEAARWCIGATGLINAADVGSNSDYEIVLGTSFAAPQVSGAIALLAQAFSTITAEQLRSRLIATADNSFFTPTHLLELAPGVQHGYDEIYGHGFLNVRDALMPIGATALQAASGEVLTLSDVTVSGGYLAGDALATSLSAASFVYGDQLNGSFRESAARLVSQVQAPNYAASRLLGWTGLSDGGSDAVLRSFDAAELNGLRRVVLLDGRDSGVQLFGLTAPDGSANGLGLRLSVDTGGGQVGAELSALHGSDGLFGLNFGGAGAAQASALTSRLFWRGAISDQIELGVEGEFGIADVAAAGLVSDVSAVGFNRAVVNLTLRSLLRDNDRFSVMVQSPLAATSGSATFSLPGAVPLSADASFQKLSASLVPQKRQINIGFEYGFPIGDASDILLGYTHEANVGNIADASRDTIIFGYRMRF